MQVDVFLAGALINRTAVTGTAPISSVESVSNVDVGVSDRNFPLCVCVCTKISVD